MTQAREIDIHLKVEPDEFPMLAESVLTRLGCKDFRYNKGYRQITARDQEHYPGRHSWIIDYDILIRWAKKVEGVIYELTVLDERNHWSRQFCQKRLISIANALYEDSMLEKAKQEPSTLYGSARLASEEDLRKAEYLTEEPEASRLLIAPWKGLESLCVTRKQTAWHALVCGPTGGGKSSGLFIPNLLVRVGTSAIVTEATAGEEAPELYTKTAGWRAHNGHHIYHFDPSDMSSTRLNPLDAVLRAPAEKRAVLADTLANLIIVNTTPEGSTRSDPIWDRSERHLLFALILHIVAAEPENAHFGAIRKLLAKSEEYLARVFSNSPSPLAKQEYEAFHGHSSENYRHGVISGLVTRLNPWVSEPIVRLTQKTDLDIQALQDQLFTFYFSVPSRRADLKPIAALMLNFLIDISLNAKFKNPMALILDEFTNFGYIPGIDQALSIIRRREMSAILGVQDFRQLKIVYGRDRAEIIASQPGTRIFFPPRDFHTAKEISDGLGYQTVLDAKFTDRGSTVERELGRPLLTPSELMELGTKILVMTPSAPPVICERFTHQTMKAPENMPPPPSPEHPVLTDYAEFENSEKRNKKIVDSVYSRQQLLEEEVEKIEAAIKTALEENDMRKAAELKFGPLVALRQSLKEAKQLSGTAKKLEAKPKNTQASDPENELTRKTSKRPSKDDVDRDDEPKPKREDRSISEGDCLLL